MLDCVFAFQQLGDVQLGFGAVQSFEPHLVVVHGGDDGTGWVLVLPVDADGLPSAVPLVVIEKPTVL